MARLGHFGTQLSLSTDKPECPKLNSLLDDNAGEKGTYLEWREPRFNLAVKVGLEGLPMSTTNISTSGMQVSCSAQLFERLPSELTYQSLSARVVLPTKQEVHCLCTVIYVSEHDDLYFLGLQFTAFRADGQKLLRQFLSLQPKSS